jgi:soluble lytic murein transglycosylase-like protein
VQPGDTLWSIAQRTGTTVAALAAANGLSPNGVLRAGAVLGAGATSSTASPTAPTQPVTSSTAGPPYPTPETLSASQVGQIGANNGATWSLTDAIGWMESGFHNYAVAPDGGVGIMQIMPGTWPWIQHSLDTGPPLNPASAADNVRAGALMLHWLLNQTGGDPALAAAGYNEGLPSVRRYGIYPQVQRYVNDVMALRAQYGGG